MDCLSTVLNVFQHDFLLCVAVVGFAMWMPADGMLQGKGVLKGCLAEVKLMSWALPWWSLTGCRSFLPLTVLHSVMHCVHVL